MAPDHQVLHMKQGEETSSYAKNSTGQKLVIMKVKHILQENIEELFQSCEPQYIRIADLGCSSGPNALLSTQNIIECIDKTYQKMNQKSPSSIEVFLNDLVGNDFNNIFKLLPNFYEKLEMKGRTRGSCFIAAMPGSFYGRLFPDHSLHFMHSSYSLHWLSQVPERLPLNKGNICPTRTSPQNVQKAYMAQFEMDFSMFLRLRSIEMVTQGHLFLTLRGNIDENTDWDAWELLGITLNDMVIEGLIEEIKLDTFNLPLYGPSMEEIQNIIDKEGSFKVLNLENFQLHWDDSYMENNDDLFKRGKHVAMNMRAVLEPILANHFGYTIMNDLFDRFAMIILKNMLLGKGLVNNLVVSLAKREKENLN